MTTRTTYTALTILDHLAFTEKPKTERWSKDTQFLLVTHNKLSMEAASSLYGVTMAVKGVSRVVSVELSEVDEFVPEATGGGASAEAEPGPAPSEDREALAPA